MNKILFFIILLCILVSVQQAFSQTLFVAHSDQTEDGVRTLEGVLHCDEEKIFAIKTSSEKGENELYVLTDDTLMILYFDGPFYAYDFFYSQQGQTWHNIQMSSMSERILTPPNLIETGTMFLVSGSSLPRVEEWNIVGGSIYIQYNDLLSTVKISMEERKFLISGKKGKDI